MKAVQPFIHLLESPNGKYFYDVNKNEIVSISDKVYFVLQNIINKQEIQIDNEVQQEIYELEQEGYLSDNRVKRIQHSVTNYLEEYMTRKLGKITLQITQSCNLRCSYCVYSENYNEKQRHHSGKRMTFDTAKKGIDFLLENSIDSEEINVAFYGGEPLLEMDLIKKVVDYIERVAIGRNITFNLTTNGTLITDEIIEYFIKHNVSMMLSLDGPKEIHDSSRRFADGTGSFDKIEEKIQHISEKYPDFAKNMMISMVINPQNDFDYINTIFNKDSIFKKMLLSSGVVDDIYSDKKIVYSKDYIVKEEYRVFLGILYCLNRLDKKYISPIVLEEINRIKYFEENFEKRSQLLKESAPSGPCIPGQLRLFVDTDGNFYPCERVNETSEAMLIGNIEEGFFIEKVDALLNIGKLTEDECRNCWAFTNCNICARCADDGNEMSRETKLKYCNGVKNSVQHDFLSIILFEEFQNSY